MEFMRTCGTGIQVLAGWTTLSYHLYGLEDHKPDNKDVEGSPADELALLDRLMGIEHLVRKRNYIAQVDVDSRTVFVFWSATGQGDFAAKPPNLGQLPPEETRNVERIADGTFNAVDLASSNTLRRVATSTPSFAAGLQTLLRPSEIYARFLAALSSTIAYRIARHSLFLPLSDKLFVPRSNQSSAGLLGHALKPLKALQISINLSGSGLLAISTSPESTVAVYRPNGPKYPAHSLVLMAPIWRVAVCLDHADDSFSSPPVILWRQLVILWLERRGISIENGEHQQSWIGLRLTTVKLKANQDKVFFWPTSLCFGFNGPTEYPDHEFATTLLSELPGSDNLGRPKSDSFSPLEFAEVWAQDERDRASRIASKRQKKNEEAMAKTIQMASPIANRPLVYGEGLGLNGVYPTPPDGLSTQQGQSSAGADPVVYSTDRSISNLPRGVKDTAMEIDTIGHADDMHDDLFNDEMDEDMFAETDIGDGDFNFFDQADEFDDSPAPKLERTVLSNHDLNLDSAHAGAQDDTLSDRKHVLSEITLPHVGKITNEMSTTGNISTIALEVGPTTPDPLDPAEVLRRLFALGTMSERKSQVSSGFGPLKFNTVLTGNQEQYNKSGPFHVKMPTAVPQKRSSDERPEDLDSQLPAKLIKKARESGLVTTGLFPSGRVVGDDDGESDDGTDVISDLRSESTGGDAMSVAFETQSQQQLQGPESRTEEQPSESKQMLNFRAIVLQPSFSSTVGVSRYLTSSLQKAWSPWTLKTIPQKSHLKFDRNFITAAQIVAEQLIYTTLDRGLCFSSTPRPDDMLDQMQTSSMLSNFQRMVRKALGASQVCSLMKYTTLQDTPQEPPHGTKLPPRPVLPRTPTGTRGDTGLPGGPTKHAIPFLRIRRSDSLWDMLPPSITFWDILGLAPINGPKNISFYTIYPFSATLESITDRFMQELGQCYESSKLGAHAPGPPILDQPKSFIPWSLGAESSLADIEESLKKLCSVIGSKLALVDHESKPIPQSRQHINKNNVESFVIYVINPFEDIAALSAISSAFVALCNSYRLAKTPSFRTRKADVVLQIVPMSVMAKLGHYVLLDSDRLRNLAREVYDRCPVASSEDVGALPICSGSSIQLTESLPRKIAFELTGDPPSNIMHNPSQFYLGYARSESGNWVTAAFTDNAGRYQAVVSYCLTGSRTFLDIAKELWETCIDIMRHRKVNWRLCISRAHAMPPEELEAWASVAAPQQALPLIALLCSVDINPPIALIPSITLPSTPPPSGASRPYTQTPIGTPITQQVVSPDPGANTPTGTPSDNVAAEALNDPDSHLVDTTDETYSIIISHRLNLQTPGTQTFHQALSSAYLIHVPPSQPTVNPFNHQEVLDPSTAHCIAVHLLFANNSGKAPDNANAAVVLNSSSNVPKVASDNIMREILGPFRNLALLAKVRGLKDGKGGIIPWHILAALKGVEGLDAVYGMERWTPSGT
ncbi:hypothetical protein BT63DRAFT_227266 [Microthyrium microscopicum]|uniref:Mediator of RNA polymerase II transcription subunit 13 n=1 Tax=Microthyrium microscopicum TaxID=703497 RepID=A0A6A6UCL3_9PEZI|nr:hypothetical protein BT63DRAFT_227266 [Microthyrium microscopicum]